MAGSKHAFTKRISVAEESSPNFTSLKVTKRTNESTRSISLFSGKHMARPLSAAIVCVCVCVFSEVKL